MCTTYQSFTVEGMTCGGCARRVGEAVRSVAGVDRAEVDLAAGTVTVNAGAPAQEVRDAVVAAGYRVA